MSEKPFSFLPCGYRSSLFYLKKILTNYLFAVTVLLDLFNRLVKASEMYFRVEMFDNDMFFTIIGPQCFEIERLNGTNLVISLGDFFAFADEGKQNLKMGWNTKKKSLKSIFSIV